MSALEPRVFRIPSSASWKRESRYRRSARRLRTHAADFLRWNYLGVRPRWKTRSSTVKPRYPHVLGHTTTASNSLTRRWSGHRLKAGNFRCQTDVNSGLNFIRALDFVRAYNTNIIVFSAHKHRPMLPTYASSHYCFNSFHQIFANILCFF